MEYSLFECYLSVSLTSAQHSRCSDRNVLPAVMTRVHLLSKVRILSVISNGHNVFVPATIAVDSDDCC